MSSWPDWVKRLVEFSKTEATTLPAIRKFLVDYEDDTGVDNLTDHSDAVVLELLLKLLYPRDPSKGCVFIKKFEACDVDLDSEVHQITQSAPYIAQTGVAGTENAQYFIACEQAVLCESKSVEDAIIDLLAVYYVFNISYPKGISAILLFFFNIVFLV